MSTSSGRSSMGRGRGKGTSMWNVEDLRHSSVKTLDFSSSLTPYGPIAASCFPGRCLANAATTHNAAWNAFGMIHEIPNGGLDPLHPLHSVPLSRPLNPSTNIGLPRTHCRDFEERGFCLRGDMCPMEHGVNQIDVGDVCFTDFGSTI